LGPNSGSRRRRDGLYPAVQPGATEGRRGTQTKRAEPLPAPPAQHSFVADYFITTERLTLNVSSEPGFTTTW
jgi:hypothetical protein